ncbi:ornithine cyclodeaminase/alanine dehydrogenase [Anaerotaenia torta]|uniref:ornithine cyclodeaminase n=1 Tax=Anaerotaenia torta TaxID=433293 RepID=UPI003D20871B
MKIISFDQIMDLGITPLQCYNWVSDAIVGKREALLPAKISLKPCIHGVFYNTMPAIIPSEKWGGVKLVTRYPDRKPSLDSEILLYDIDTGENVALMDGNWITAMRTGAVAAHAVKLLARDDFSLMGLIGLGNTARATLKVLLAIYPERQLTIKLKKYKDQHDLFAKEFEAYSNVKFLYYDSFEDVIENSDVIISAATVFEEDICQGKFYKEGVLVVPIHTRGFTNCDLFFDKVFADDTNHVKSFKYFDRFKFFSEVSDVVCGNKPGRENYKERILAYNIGIALHDIYFAGKIYEMIGNTCPDVSLNAPIEKFWV